VRRGGQHFAVTVCAGRGELRFHALVLLVLLVAACGRSDALQQRKSDTLTAVEIVRLDGAGGSAQVSGIGTVAYDQEVNLSFPVAGIVSAILVDDGSPVSAGQVIARIQADTATADLGAATAEARRADQARRRIETLSARGFATRAQLETAQAAAAAARARTEQAQFVARNSVLRATRSGRILARLAEAGQVVQPGMPVVRMGESGAGLIARLAFPDGSGVTAGTPISLVIGQGANTVIRTASVRRILPLRNAATGTLEAEVSLPPGVPLAAGSIVRATANVSGGAAVIRLPLSALVDGRTDQATVYVLDQANRVRRRDLTFDGLRGDQIAVTTGLSAGDRIVIRGVPYVRPGQQVRVTKEVNGRWSD
jgi:RND family efflux transporter MFP subunit